jgi:hypothetical protein
VEDQKAQIRALVFNHLAGIVLAPTVKALWDRRVFDLFASSSEPLSLQQIVQKTHANRGYMRVALRLLASAGWLNQYLDPSEDRPRYALTRKGEAILRFAPMLYGEVTSFVPKAIFLEDFLFGKTDSPVLPSFQELVRRSNEHWAIDPAEEWRLEVCRHLDGMLIGPSIVALARGGLLSELEHDSVAIERIAANRASLNLIFELLSRQGWLARDAHFVGFTECGRYAAQIATSYGVTVSYLPLLDNLSTLLFGNARIPRVDENGGELLVNRAMNVWGSGGAHKTYFRKLDEIVVEIFNRPLHLQPRGISDMGCGDGTLLIHLFEVIKNRTLRGAALDKCPLPLIGVDFNKVARRVTKRNMQRAEIPLAHVIAGDINRPAQLAGDLEGLGYDIHDLLHVRSFLDHNRPYLPPAGYVPGARVAKSTGAFAHLGQDIAPDELEENLVRHLKRWAPYVGRFGLLVLELHTLPPELTAANLNSTPAVAYDGTHGFSDQYLVEIPVFLDCASEAGLRAEPCFQSKFPNSELATVSLNFFTAAESGRPASLEEVRR